MNILQLISLLTDFEDGNSMYKVLLVDDEELERRDDYES